MRKINALLKEHPESQFSALAKQAIAHLNLRQLWEAINPSIISQNSFAGSLNNGQLTVYAYNASVATKIKLSSASLLTQLQNLQKSDSFYKDCKVTAITVKVQVKSQVKTTTKAPRKLSKEAAFRLNDLASQLGETVLSEKLKQIANKH
ncbi:MAG: DciA family protein [Methylophilaceae bacterium]